LLSAGRDLLELPVIVKDLADKIADIVKTGHFALLDTLKKKPPSEFGDMTALTGLGPNSIKLLCGKPKVRTLVPAHPPHRPRPHGPMPPRRSRRSEALLPGEEETHEVQTSLRSRRAVLHAGISICCILVPSDLMLKLSSRHGLAC
jgi:hypothetical protein